MTSLNDTRVTMVLRAFIDDLYSFLEVEHVERRPHASGTVWNATLSSGAAGAALFAAQVDQVLGIDRARDVATSALDHALESLERDCLTPGLHSGFVGTGWVVRELQRCDWAPARCLDLSPIDDAVREYIATAPYDACIDVVRGVAGCGVYAVDHWDATFAAEVVPRVVEFLGDRAVRNEAGTAWLTGPRELTPVMRRMAPHGWYDAGLAHGAAGVAVFLALATPIAPRAAELLESTVEWLLNQQVERTSGARFPAGVAPDGDRLPGRTAWCYGDLGIAVALYSAGRALQRRDFEDQALDLVRHVARQSDAHLGFTHDYGICHGSAGFARVLSRFDRVGDDRLIGDAAAMWLDRTLGPVAIDVDSFRLAPTAERPLSQPTRNFGLLEGTAGIGLTLLSALESCGSWELPLLLSMVDR